jgi:hypothetical protein
MQQTLLFSNMIQILNLVCKHESSNYDDANVLVKRASGVRLV